MITKEDLRNERVWACGEWYDKFVLDFPSGVETTPDGWLSLIRAGYGPVISWLLINTDDEIFRPNLRGADLRGADLHGADLRGADLHGAYLSGTNLHGADLHGADLSGTNLGWTDLGGADLSGADLSEADLRGADLHGAYLSGTNLHGADLHGAKYKSKTIFPDGFDPIISGLSIKSSLSEIA